MENKKNLNTVIECIIVCGLLVLSLLNSYINILTLVLCIYFVWSNECEDVLCILMFLISFDKIFKIQLGGFALINIVELALVLRLLYCNGMKIPRRGGNTLFFFAACAIMISFGSGLVDSVRIVVTLLMCLLLMTNKNGNYNVGRLYEYVSGGLVLSSIVAMGSGIFPRLKIVFGTRTIKLGAGLYYFRFSGLHANPNYYTVLISVALAVFAVMYIYKKTKLIDYFYAIALLILGLMAASMSFVVSILILLCMVAFVLVRHNIKFVLGGLIILAGFGILIYSLRNTDYVSTILFRLQSYSDDENLTASTLTTGRTDLWMIYIKYLSNNIKSLLFGVGIGADAYDIVGCQAHNYFIEIFFYMGVIVGTVYISAMTKIFGAKQYCMTKPKLQLYIPLGIFLVRCFARCLLTDDQLVFMIMLCMITVIYFTNINSDPYY